MEFGRRGWESARDRPDSGATRSPTVQFAPGESADRRRRRGTFADLSIRRRIVRDDHYVVSGDRQVELDRVYTGVDRVFECRDRVFGEPSAGSAVAMRTDRHVAGFPRSE